MRPFADDAHLIQKNIRGREKEVAFDVQDGDLQVAWPLMLGCDFCNFVFIIVGVFVKFGNGGFPQKQGDG